MANTVRNKPGDETVILAEKSSDPMLSVQARYEKHKKRINTVVFVVVVAIIGYFGYTKLYMEPRETKAATAMAFAQRYFEADSVQKALNGDGQHQGFLRIMKKYSGTRSANLCNYYAGVCYLKTGDFKNAIKYLEDFNGHGTHVAYVAWGSLGDAHMENKNTKKAAEYYEKAAGNKDDNAITPLYLSRAAMAYEMENKPEEAKKLYSRIKDEYPMSAQAREIDKNLARLGVLD